MRQQAVDIDMKVIAIEVTSKTFFLIKSHGELLDLIKNILNFFYLN